MKTVCTFCKTEYSLNSVPTNPVQCAVCGNVWNVPVPRHKNSFMVFIAAISALMAAAIFTVVIITKYNEQKIKKHPLVAQIETINTITDDLGTKHFIVKGSVTNKSNNIYGVPDLLIISHDKDGNIIDKQKFFAAATLLDSGTSARFSHTLSVPVDNVRKITVELKK